MKRLLVVLALTLAVVPAGIAAAGTLGSTTEQAEQELLALTNAARQQAGLTPLAWASNVATTSRTHSTQMAGAGVLSHTADLVAALAAVAGSWTLLGENVGIGPNVAAIHNALMNSPLHRQNILGTYHQIGIGFARDASGAYWVTQSFVAVGTTTPQSAAPAAAPKVAAPTPAPARAPVAAPATAPQRPAASAAPVTTVAPAPVVEAPPMPAEIVAPLAPAGAPETLVDVPAPARTTSRLPALLAAGALLALALAATRMRLLIEDVKRWRVERTSLGVLGSSSLRSSSPSLSLSRS